MNKTLPLSRSMLIAGCVAVGIAAAWFMVTAWFMGIMESAMQNRQPYENVYTTVTGEPVIARTTSGNMQETEKIMSLSGEPLKITSQDLLHAYSVNGPDRHPTRVGEIAWQSRMTAANDGGVPPMYWYFVHDGEIPGHAYGIGYHAPTQTVVGYFGRSGFVDSMPPRSDWFDVPGQSGMQGMTTTQFHGQVPRWSGFGPRPLLLADGKLWKIDLVQKQVSKLVDCPEGYRLGQAWRILENPRLQSADVDQRSAASVTPQDCVVREPESLLIVNPKNGESKRYMLPAEMRRHIIATSILPDGNLLLLTQRSYSDADQNVIWLTPNGEIAKQQTIPRKLQWQQWSLAAMGWRWAIDAPLPLVNAAGTLGWLPNFASDEEEEDYSRALGIVLWRTWPSILAVFLLGCGMAPLAYRRQKRFGLPHPVAWAVFAFVFGLPGWLAYRFHRTWPVLEECPACRQASPRDREDCLDCGKAFPRPPLKGIEVFA
jgi:hypothetical protein